ncbi:MAG: 2,5-diamino-6-(ribosylamino)-4(3H)-pyrimidinone 5'-phosphate reductase [Promethearchaeota archaeon]|nr:MAG: 2,5-diamino-6-(ribosylamino)-4(3H)-pyrimidinone 5'-phosphate reductase [Candidatus Lokiarchaeota archaeon]
MNDYKKPYIILSAAMTIDGKIASKEGDPELSDAEDWRAVHKLRTEVDAILVGKGTIIKDDPKLHIKFHTHKGYYRIVIDSKLDIPIESKVIVFKPELYPTVICTTENVHEDRIAQYEAKGIKVLRSGKSNKVDIVSLMPKLYDLGIKSLLLEGGGTLNWSFFKNNLVDEIRLTIAPWVVGGKNAISLVDGEGFSRMSEATKFSLITVQERDNYVVLKYKSGKL